MLQECIGGGRRIVRDAGLEQALVELAPTGPTADG